MMPYILHTALILSACLAFYKLLLQKETFFYLNRFVLLGCMLLAFILPLLPVPEQLTFRKAEKSVSTNYSPTAVSDNTTITSEENNAIIESINAQNISLQQVLTWLVYLYWFGVVVFVLNFLLQIVLLLYKAYSLPVIRDGKFRIVEVKGDKAPCSFGNNIFINPANYDWDTYNQILLHEKIHVDQKHTLDLLLAEIVLVFQWFNPFAWLWRKELENNLEFLTDDKLLKQDRIEKKSYQISLLKATAPHFPLSLTTNYNQSLLKKITYDELKKIECTYHLEILLSPPINGPFCKLVQ
jgi:beta-lactamase regulating signal transducer with metallopeptidase domain